MLKATLQEECLLEMERAQKDKKIGFRFNAFYNTYLHSHRLKFQSILLPNGMWALVYGALQRHNDLGMLNMSGITDNILQYFVTNGVEVGDGTIPSLNGDQIYIAAVTHKIDNTAPGSLERLLNKRMNIGRTTIEHQYTDLFSMFKLLKMKHKFRIFKNGKEMHTLVLVSLFCITFYHATMVTRCRHSSKQIKLILPFIYLMMRD